MGGPKGGNRGKCPEQYDGYCRKQSCYEERSSFGFSHQVPAFRCDIAYFYIYHNGNLQIKCNNWQRRLRMQRFCFIIKETGSSRTRYARSSQIRPVGVLLAGVLWERDMLKYLKKFGKECILAPFFKMLEASFELFVPLVVAAIIDKGIIGGNAAHIWRMCGILIALAAIGLTCAITAQYFSAKAAVGFAAHVRHSLFKKLTGLSFSDMDKLGTSVMITRMTSDVNQAQTGVNMTLRLFLRSPVVVLGSMIMAFTIDYRCAMIFLVAIVLLSLVVFGIMALNIPMMKGVQQQLERVLGATRENLTGARVIRAFRREDAEYRAFVEKNRRLTTLQKRAGSISALLNPLTYVIINFAVIVLIHRGAIKVDNGVLTQGEVVALYNYMSQILVELIKLANLIVTMNKAAASWKRISDVLAIEPAMSSPEKLDEAEKADTPAVAFKNVFLRYPGASSDSLEGVDFAVGRGKTVGIIGGTGSSKSSLVRLIPRFYDVTGGSVEVNGVDVRKYPVEVLRNKIGFVLQKAVLFKGTIRENIRWGNPDATDAEVEAAVRLAQAEDVVSVKGGLDAMVEQEGRNLSGGQKQRLTIARALVRRPEILVLDDSASALDMVTDARLRRAIAELDYHPTVFIVSQRTASIMNADEILVLDDGRIAGRGTHAELLESCEIYREIYESQFRREDESK